MPTTSRHRHLATALLLLATSPAAAPLQAQSAVSPADRATLEGSSFTHFPLGRHDARFQFLYGDLPPGMVIHGHAFRRDAIGVRGQVDGFSADLEVTLSLSPNSPATASGTFANNVGAQPTVVLPRTTLSFPGTDRPPLDPAPSFDLIVPYQVPFVLPPGQTTLCVDSVLYGNTSPAGSNRNLSIYLDAHEIQTNGTSEQPGYRLGSGCPPPGGAAASYANLSLWNLVGQSQLDLALRNGVAEDGSGQTRAFVAIGLSPISFPWPSRPACAQLSSAELWFPMQGTMSTTGSYTGSLTGLPAMPPGYRLWCQAGSIHLGTGALAFGDLSTVVTPPPGPTTLPAVRISASTNRLATSGSVSTNVPVTMFF